MVTLGERYSVVCRSYACNKCGGGFQGYDRGVLEKLPLYIRSQFPFVVHKKVVLDNTLVDMLCRQVVKKQSVADFRKLVSELGYLKYWRTVHEYVSLELSKRGREENTWRLGIGPDPNRAVPEFGYFDDRDGYRGQVPSQYILKRTFIQKQAKSATLKTRSVMGLTGKILCGDHTFQVAKVPFAGHQRMFEAMYSIMNEHGQVIGYWMTSTKSLTEIKVELQTVCERYVKLKGNDSPAGPDAFFTDSCCNDREILSQVFPSLRTGSVIFEQVPKTEFQGHTLVCSTPEEVEEACKILSKSSVVGFDIEWPVKIDKGVQQSKAAVLQLCSESKSTEEQTVAIIQLSQLAPETLPPTLSALLSDERVKKVGVGIKADAAKLKKDWNLKVAGVVDIRDIPEVAEESILSKKLESLVLYYLHQHLEKKPTTIFSDWQAPVLSEHQIAYAANDAFASISLYEFLSTPAEERPPVPDLPRRTAEALGT